MGYRVHEDEELTEQVSLENIFTNPDDESSIDGDAGETKVKPLWVAVEQTTLGAAITETDATSITLAVARFADETLPIIIIDSEKMLITAGFGTTSLTVTRGYHNTTPATHSLGAAVKLAYDIASATITSDDNSGTDEADWIDYCLDDGEGDPDGSYSNPLSLGAIAQDESVAIHRRVVVPASTPAQYKQDLIHVVNGQLTECA